MARFQNRISSVWLLITISIAAGCSPERWRPLPPPPRDTAAVVPEPPPPTTEDSKEPESVEEAEEASPPEADAPDDALAAYAALAEEHAALERQRDLLHEGLMRARLSGSPQAQREARSYLTRLQEEYPDSPLAAEIEVIIELQSEVEKLRSVARERAEAVQRLDAELERLRVELETLKEIDIRRRNPDQ